MNAPPRVSVVLPTHNRATLLRRAIDSVLAQSYPHFELFVVDDASTDATPDVVRAFTDPRVRYLRLNHNRRAAAARNAGVAQSNGALLAFQDDDDTWLPDKLARQVEALQRAPADVGLNLCGHVRQELRGETRVSGAANFAGLRFDRGPFGDFSLVATPGWLLRRECFDRAGGFDERMRAWDDWELALRLSRICRFEHLDEVLWRQDRLRGGTPGMVDSPQNFGNDLRVLLEKHGAGWPARVVSRQWYLAGFCDATSTGTASALPALRRAIATNPWNGKAWVALGLAHCGQRVFSLATAGTRRITGRLASRHGTLEL